MNAEISMSQLWWNKSLLSFFFTNQAIKEFEDFVLNHKYEGISSTSELIAHLDSVACAYIYDVDALADLFHHADHNGLVEYFELTEVTE